MEPRTTTIGALGSSGLIVNDPILDLQVFATELRNRGVNSVTVICFVNSQISVITEAASVN